MKSPVTTLLAFGETKAPGIRAMSALLRKRGWSTNIVIYKTGYSEKDMPSQREQQLLLGLLRDLGTDIVGLSVFSPFYRPAAMLTKQLKKSLHSIVVWGGAHATIAPEQCIGAADIACIGEGEGPLVDLVERKAKGECVDDIQNLWVRTEDGITRNALRPLMRKEELEEMPFPDIGEDNTYCIDRGRIAQWDPLTAAMEYNTLASRGCPFRCSGCINSVLVDMYREVGPAIRIKSPEYVVSEITHALQRCPSVKRIRFHEMYSMNHNWVERFCHEYTKHVRLPFMVASHPHNITDKAIGMLREAGLMVVALGVQSPCSRVRKEILQRSDSDEEILNSVRIMQKHRVDACFDLIVDNPYENDRDKAEGLDFLLKIPKPYTVHPVSLEYFPAHRLTERALSDGVIDNSRVEGLTSQGWFKRTYEWRAARSDRDASWNCLYVLASRSVVPPGLIRWVSRLAASSRKRKALELLTKVTAIPDYGVIFIRRLLRGHLSLFNMAKIVKSKAMKRVG